MKDSFQEVFAGSKRVLVVMSHPDDAEIVCGGTISRLTAEGVMVRLVVVTNGEKGVKDKKGVNLEEFADSRIEEQKSSGSIMGIDNNQNFNLEIPDGELEASLENIGKIVFHIRDFKPDVVITHNPLDMVIKVTNNNGWVNHRDHRKTGEIVCDAVYPYSRDRAFFPEQLEGGLEPHSVQKILFSDSYTSREVRYFDISKYTETKLKAIKSHPSAINPDDAQDYLEENKMEDGYFEPMTFWQVY